ncbi:hypothetical protein MPTA5024_02150 [Microbispora sp. ATCC PTA-5024]|nr:hypothetical protein MPTA5024_02150 [Microbispora sp. ATCC PTA-5024]
MTYMRSSHLLLSPSRYRTDQGELVRLAYSARTGTLFPLAVETAARLEAGETDRVPGDSLARLIDVEAVVPEGEAELATVLGRMRKGGSGARMRRFALMPTAYCNMACAYCGQEHRRTAIRERRATATVERVLAALADPETTRLNIMWFGGEPLMALRIIREMSRTFVAEAERLGKEYLSDITTNGSLLTERNLALLYEECRIRWFEITLDGPAEVHDRRRLKKNGTGSFARVVSLISDVVRKGRYPGLGFGIRVNIDVHNEDHVSDLIADLACHGMGGDPRVKLSLAAVHSWGNDVSDREIGRRRYAGQEMEWLGLAQALGFEVSLLPAAARASTCIATTRSAEVVDPDGGVYSCSEHPLVPGDRDRGLVATVEDLTAGDRRPAGMFDQWYDEVQDEAWPCARCPFLPVCGGGCPKRWKEGDIACPSYKFNWAGRMDLAAAARGLVLDD